MNGKKVIVISPHPDDETLGCGGTLLALKNKGYSINWLIITGLYKVNGFTEERIESRSNEINNVRKMYGFDEVSDLGIATTKVDSVPVGDLVFSISEVLKKIRPNIVFTPFINDVHTDHKIISEAVISCSKWFRHPYIESVLYYETISETDFNIDSSKRSFCPNVFIDISSYLETKIEILKIYESELAEFPFPRSEKTIRNLAHLRGSQSGSEAAEAFELLRTNIKFE